MYQQQKQIVRGKFVRVLKSHFSRRCRSGMNGVLLAAALSATPGCAVHYRNAARGEEHLWGFGQLALNVRPINDRLVSVASGSCAPGFCCNIDQGSVSISFGHLIRQHLLVVNSSEAADFQFPHGSMALAWQGRETNSLWGIGHLKMKTAPASDHHALISSETLTGLSASGGSERGLKFGFVNSRETSLPREDTCLEFSRPAESRGGFDLFDVRVDAPVSINPEPTEP